MPGEFAGEALPFNARILVVKPRSGLGDFILLMPALRALRNTYPEAFIDLLVSQELKPVIESAASLTGLHLFDRIIGAPKKIPPRFASSLSHAGPVNAEFTVFIRLLRALHTAQYDAVLLFQYLEERSHSTMMRMLVLATGAAWKAGLESGQATFLNVKVPYYGFGAKHQAEYAMDIVEAVGAKVHDRSLFFPVDADECRQARMLLVEQTTSLLPRPMIAIHPGCASYMPARRWGPERFARVADLFYEKYGGKAVLVGGSEELALREQVAAAMRSAMPICMLSGQESIGLVAAVIEHCDLFVGNDSGLMHLSAAVGTPTLGIFGLTNHRAWGPYTPAARHKSMVVRLNLPCMPCAYVGRSAGSIAGCATRACLTALSARKVAEAAYQLFCQNSGLS